MMMGPTTSSNIINIFNVYKHKVPKFNQPFDRPS